MKLKFLSVLSASSLCLIPASWGQNPQVVSNVANNQLPSEEDLIEQAFLMDDDGQIRRNPEDAAVETRENARFITRVIPAPRGLIADRNGRPMARSKVSYYFGIQFPQFAEDATDDFIITWARRRVGQMEELLGREVPMREKDVVKHYRERRWVPMLFPQVVTAAQESSWSAKLMRGLEFQAIYLRDYPAKSAAAHVIGYVRSTGKLPKGPVFPDEAMWELTTGATGLENTLDNELAGKNGEWTLLVDENGDRLRDKCTRPPESGNTVVTTLNLTWQEHAEAVLRRSCKRGAFVVVDIQTGEILVLASRPSFDLNVWIPRISEEDYAEIKNDERSPEYARAFKATYPPASTFKPVVAVTALTTGTVSEWSTYNCPPFITIAGRKFRNHSSYPAGNVSVKKALAISNNPWFYQAGMAVGGNAFLSVARRMGYGVRTGVPLYGESAGIIPDEEYIIKKEGRPMTRGDVANMAIGQGFVSSTPLQVAQGMAAIANGDFLPQLRLIKQIQSPSGEVLVATQPSKRYTLGITPQSAKITRTGMMQVVNADYGTGRKGRTNFCKVAGKTGTAQWKGSGRTKQELAWFSGFLPHGNPRFAFAILYEGSPGESVSGGSYAAPMVGRFFNRFGSEIMSIARTKVVINEDETVEEEYVEEEDFEREEQRELILRALPVDGTFGDEEAVNGGENEESNESSGPVEGILRSNTPLIPLSEDLNNHELQKVQEQQKQQQSPRNAEGVLKAVPIPE